MFEQPHYVANSLNVIFPQVQQIRRCVNDFEDRLSEAYGQPQTIPVPDDLDPQVPRLVFQSLGGHSQIVISQVSIALNVTYDGDWTTDSSKRLAYLQQRVPLVYALCEVAGAEPGYSGLTSRARLETSATDEQILNRFVAVTGVGETPTALSEASLRLSSVVDSRFFDNTTIQSYRQWRVDAASPATRFSSATATSRGLELINDFNDRYAFNEDTTYQTSEAAGLAIVARAQDSLDAWVTRITEV